MTEIFRVGGSDLRDELLTAVKNDQPFTSQAIGGKEIEVFNDDLGFVLLQKNRVYMPDNNTIQRIRAVIEVYKLLGRSSLRTGYYTCRQKPEYAQYFKGAGKFSDKWLDAVSKAFEIICDIDREVITFGTPDGVIFYPYSRRYGAKETMISLSEDIAKIHLKYNEVEHCMNILVNEKMANALELINDQTGFLQMLNMMCVTRGGRYNRAILKLVSRFDNLKNVLLWTDADVFGSLRGTTRITVAHGPSKRIRDIQEEEKLLTWNHREKKFVETTVIAKKSEWMPREKLMYFVIVNEGHIQTLIASKNHPFYILNKGWTDVEELKFGDIILDARILLQKEKNKNNIPTGAWKWRDEHPEEFQKQQKELSHRPTKTLPTFTENIVIELAQENNWPIEFVGNRSFFIEDYNPDFVIKNQKKVIEVTSKHRHRDTLDNYIKRRTAIFERNGYKCLFLVDNEHYGFDLKSEFKTKIVHFLTNGAKIIKIVDLAKVPKKYAVAYFAHLKKENEFKVENGQMLIKMYDLQCEPYQHYLVEDGMLAHNCDIREVVFRGSKNLRHQTPTQTSRSAYNVGLFPSVAAELEVPVDIDEKKPMSGDEKTGARKMVEHLRRAGLHTADLQTFYDDKTFEIEGLHAKFTNRDGKPIGTQIYIVEYLRAMGLECKPQPPEDDIQLQNELCDALYTAMRDRIYDTLEAKLDFDIDTNVINDAIVNFIGGQTDAIAVDKGDEIRNLVYSISVDEIREKIRDWYVNHPKTEIYNIADIAEEMISSVHLNIDIDTSNLQAFIEDKLSEVVDKIDDHLSIVNVDSDIVVQEFEKVEVVKDYYDMVLRRLGASKDDILKIREALQHRLES